MALFRCENCGCIENTAFSNYFARNMKKMWTPEYHGKQLCSECGPPTYLSGEKTQYGTWHGKFEKKSAIGMFIDQSGHLWSQAQIDAGYLPRNYTIVGKVME